MKIVLFRSTHTGYVIDDGKQEITIDDDNEVMGLLFLGGKRFVVANGTVIDHGVYGTVKAGFRTASGTDFALKDVKAEMNGRFASCPDWISETVECRKLLEDVCKRLEIVEADMRKALAPDRYDTLGVMSPSDKTDF